MKQHYIDLSHTLHDGLVSFQGLPATAICDYWTREDSAARYDDGSSFHIARIDMVGNAGTYVDVPFHRYADGQDLSGQPLDSLAHLPAVVVSANGEEVKAIDAAFFYGLELEGRAVLVHTGWDQHWQTDRYHSEHPFLTADAAEYLVAQQVALVGIDAYNIDDTRGRQRPVHSILLGAGIPIVEHLRGLEQIPDRSIYFSAVPPRVQGMGSFPVRAFVQWTEQWLGF
ncbi:MAG: cyclase family protein [Bacteroidia bacterium]